MAGSTEALRNRIAFVALRRSRSPSKRKVSPEDQSAQQRDLAHALVAEFEKNPKLVGPLKQDYEYLAGELLTAFRAQLEQGGS